MTPETDQEEVARLFTRYDLLALPVVDPDGTLVGQSTVDDVLDVIHEEATEDIYKMAGTSDQEIAHPSVFGVAWVRLPWLLLVLLGSFLSGLVIHVYDVTLERVITLAAFIPVIMATGGNSGMQASTVTVRGLVTVWCYSERGGLVLVRRGLGWGFRWPGHVSGHLPRRISRCVSSGCFSASRYRSGGGFRTLYYDRERYSGAVYISWSSVSSH